MSTFSIGNLHFLDDTGKIDQFSLSTIEKNTRITSASEIKSQSENIYSSTTTTNLQNNSEFKQELTTSNTLVTNNTLIIDNNENNSINSSNSSSVEFDENLNVLNELEGSESNSLRTIDYSENQQDPNQPYQIIFTINNLNKKNEEITNHNEKKEVRFNNNKIDNDDDDKDFDFNFSETTYKPRPDRPKSAVKRQTHSSDIKSSNNDNRIDNKPIESNEKKLNPIANKRPGLLSHSFWSEIEQEVLDEDNNQNKDNNNDDIEENKDDIISNEDEILKEIKDEQNEDVESLSSEKDQNDQNLVKIDHVEEEESHNEETDEEEIEELQNDGPLNESSVDSSSINSSANNIEINNNTTQVMLNELKNHIQQLFNSNLIKNKNNEQIQDDLNEIKQKIGQSNLNMKLNQFKIELIDEFNQIVINELKLQKERNRLELSDFKLQLENLEQHFNRQIRQIEQNLVNEFDKSIKKSITESFNEQNKYSKTDYEKNNEQIKNLTNSLEVIKQSSFSFENEFNKLLNQLDSKLNLDSLKQLIANLNSKIDELNKNNKLNKSIFSSDEESDNELDRKNLIDLDNKLDSIKLLLNEINDYQKTLNLNQIKDEQIKENLKSVKFSNEVDIDKENQSDKDENQSDNQISPLNNNQMQLTNNQSNPNVTLECDLCDLANRIRTNLRSFRTSFYRQKLSTYSKCTYTSNFLNELDGQLKLGDINSKHDHCLSTENLDGKLKKEFKLNDLETKINTNLKTFINQTRRDVRDKIAQLNELGNFNFKNNSELSQLIKLDDSCRLKQIQLMRFNINKRLIKLNQMIVQNY